MKRPVAFIIHDLNSWGGQDRSTLEIAKALSHLRPVEIFSYSLNDPSFPKQWGDVRYHQIKPNIRKPVLIKSLYFLLRTFLDVGICRRLNKRPYPILHSTGACSLVNQIIQIQFVQSAWDHQKDLLKKNNLFHLLNSKGALKILYHHLLMSFNKFLERKLYKKKFQYIALANVVKAELKKFFNLDTNVNVVYHGINSEQFSPPKNDKEWEQRDKLRERLNIPKEALILLFVGAYDRKGLKTAICSLKEVCGNKRKNIYLVAVGSGDVKQFSELARSQGLENNVRLVSHKKDILPYYQAANLFLLPTLYEPFGLVILEAMSCGLVPIISKSSGAAELIKDEVSGFLINDPTATHEISSYIEKLVDNKSLIEQMAHSARRVAQDRPWKQVALEYDKIFSLFDHE